MSGFRGVPPHSVPLNPGWPSVCGPASWFVGTPGNGLWTSGSTELAGHWKNETYFVSLSIYRSTKQYSVSVSTELIKDCKHVWHEKAHLFLIWILLKHWFTRLRTILSILVFYSILCPRERNRLQVPRVMGQLYHQDMKIRKTLAWKALNDMKMIWRLTMSKELKLKFFRATVEAVLLYGSECWAMNASLKKSLWRFVHPHVTG